MRRLIPILILVFLIGCSSQVIQEAIEDPGPRIIGAVVSDTPTFNHQVKLTDEGFEPHSLTINSEQRVEWEIAYHTNSAVLTSECQNMQSPALGPGDKFVWTFLEPAHCTIQETIYNKHSMTITIN